MRISDWSSDVCSSDLPAKAVTLAKAGFGQYWGEGKDIAKPEQLAGILKTQDIPEAELAAAAEDAAARQAVIDTTAAAGQLNAFGTPTFLVDGEMFWGSDRLDHIDRWLARHK